jgi:hypothetical protein
MNELTTYKQQILNGIKDFPPELLAEVADFVEFVRHRRISSPSHVIEVTTTETSISWQDLAGAIPADDLELMAHAIEVS